MTRPIVQQQNVANAAQIEALAQRLRELAQELAQAKVESRLHGQGIANIGAKQRETDRKLAELLGQG